MPYLQIQTAMNRFLSAERPNPVTQSVLLMGKPTTLSVRETTHYILGCGLLNVRQQHDNMHRTTRQSILSCTTRHGAIATTEYPQLYHILHDTVTSAILGCITLHCATVTTQYPQLCNTTRYSVLGYITLHYKVSSAVPHYEPQHLQRHHTTRRDSHEKYPQLYRTTRRGAPNCIILYDTVSSAVSHYTVRQS